jgi:hypothetical protein
VAEDLNLRIMDIVAAAGTSFAFPSQTTYLESGTGMHDERTKTVEEQVGRWRERGELLDDRLREARYAQVLEQDLFWQGTLLEESVETMSDAGPATIPRLR